MATLTPRFVPLANNDAERNIPAYIEIIQPLIQQNDEVARQSRESKLQAMYNRRVGETLWGMNTSQSGGIMALLYHGIEVLYRALGNTAGYYNIQCNYAGSYNISLGDCVGINLRIGLH